MWLEFHQITVMGLCSNLLQLSSRRIRIDFDFEVMLDRSPIAKVRVVLDSVLSQDRLTTELWPRGILRRTTKLRLAYKEKCSTRRCGLRRR